MSLDLTSTFNQLNFGMVNPNGHSIYAFGEFRLDAEKLMLYKGSEEISLPPKVIKTLAVLVEDAGKILSKDELMEKVWEDSIVEEANLSQYLYLLRKTLGQTPDGHPFIETLRRRGYRFNGDVTLIQTTNGSKDLNTRPAEESNGPATDVETHSGRLYVLKDWDHRNKLSSPRTQALPKPSFYEDDGTQYDKISSDAGFETPVRNNEKRGRVFGKAITLISVIVVLAVILGGVIILTKYRGSQAGFQSIGLKAVTSSGNASFPAISPDGRLMAFVVTEAGKQTLWIQQVADRTSEIRLTEPKKDEVFYGVTFSRDSSSVYFLLRSKNDSIKYLYSVPILGGESRALIADIDSPPTFSPDGRQIAFLRRNSREGITALLIADADGSNIRQLTTRKSPQNFVLKPISWSPDGNTIACFSILREDVSERSLVLLNAQTGEEKLVSKQKWNDVDSVVWVSNSEMLLSATGPAKPLLLQIWAVDPYQDTSRQLTDDLSDYSDLTIATETGEVSAAQSQLESYIWLEELQSPAASRRLSQNKYDGVSGITWDPNGDLIFSSVINGKNSLQRASMADLSIKPITADGKYVFRNPVATPDRKYIIYSSNQEQPESIWRMDIDGKNQRRLVSVPADLADCLSDSQTVLFSAQHNGHVALWKISIDGGDPQLLSDATAFRPKISPDGQSVAFYFRKEAKAPWQIGIMPINENRISHVIDLPKTVALSSQFSWTSDGKGLILIDSRGLINNLWSYPLNGQQPKQLTDLNDDSFPRIIHFAFSPDGSRIALTRSRFVSDVVLITSQSKK